EPLSAPLSEPLSKLLLPALSGCGFLNAGLSPAGRGALLSADFAAALLAAAASADFSANFFGEKRSLSSTSSTSSASLARTFFGGRAEATASAKGLRSAGFSRAGREAAPVEGRAALSL